MTTIRNSGYTASPAIVRLAKMMETNWGFKTPIQFQVALKLAQSFHHLWGNQIETLERIPQPNGATKLVPGWRDPVSPAEAAEAASKYISDMSRRWGYCLAQYGTPTPSWESGSGTYKISVRPDGNYTMILNGIIEQFHSVQPMFTRTNHHLVDQWWTKWQGRAANLAEAVKGVVDCSHEFWGAEKEDIIEMFESDPNFWRTGLQAGTRWYA